MTVRLKALGMYEAENSEDRNVALAMKWNKAYGGEQSWLEEQIWKQWTRELQLGREKRAMTSPCKELAYMKEKSNILIYFSF